MKTATETCTEQNFLQPTLKTEILSHKHLKAQTMIFFYYKIQLQNCIIFDSTVKFELLEHF